MTDTAILNDKLVDFVTGLGTERDRTTTQSFGVLDILSEVELQTMHRSDWVARKAVDIVPQDMTREGRRWKGKKEQITEIEKIEHDPLINFWPNIREALTRARLSGGAAIMIGIKDQDVTTPLDVETVGKGQLAYLSILRKTQLTAAEIQRDPRLPGFNKPKMWSIAGTNGVSVDIHPSRIVQFIGAPILTDQPRSTQEMLWGDSILQIIYSAVKNAASVQQHVAGLVPDARTDVIYIPGLGAILQNPKDEAALQRRFSIAAMLKSMFRLTLLEGNGETGPNGRGEKWEQRTVSFSQLPELMRQYLQIAAGAADIPITRFLGESPGGENSTGEADMRNYYDHVKALQRLTLQPQIATLDEVIIRSALGNRPPEIHYEWAPLWALSETEKAEILSKKAEAARKIVGTGKDVPLINTFAVSDSLVNSLIEDGSLPGLEAAVKTHGALSDTISEDNLDPAAASEKAAKIAADAKAKQPAPAPGAVVDAEPRTLYVSRKLLNTSEFVKWASDQGLSDILASDDLHVTVLYSKTPVDWMKMGYDMWSSETGKITVPPGGPRVVERLGEKSTVLSFSSSHLSWRHRSMVELGASSEYEDYYGHVTISNSVQKIDLSRVVPFQGQLRFGPEIFQEVK